MPGTGRAGELGLEGGIPPGDKTVCASGLGSIGTLYGYQTGMGSALVISYSLALNLYLPLL